MLSGRRAAGAALGAEAAGGAKAASCWERPHDALGEERAHRDRVPATTRMSSSFDEQTVSRVVHRADDSQLPLYSGSARILRLFSPPR
jgi:hypothetical protein